MPLTTKTGYQCQKDWPADCFVQSGDSGVVVSMSQGRNYSMPLTTKTGYQCQKDWPADCFVQSGDSGVVVSMSQGSYETAFFEAFPKDPDTFIRGEGETVEVAEAAAFKKLQMYLSCDHDFKRISDTGGGKCRHCSMQVRNALPNISACGECGATGAEKRHPERKRERICLSCLAGSAGDRLLAANPSQDWEKQRAEKGLGRERADYFFTQSVVNKLQVLVLRRLNDTPEFAQQSEDKKADDLGGTKYLVYRTMGRVGQWLVENFLSTAEGSDLFSEKEVGYLDDVALYEALATTDTALESLSELAVLIMSGDKSELQEPEVKRLKDDIDKAYEGFMKPLAVKLMNQLAEWVRNPPADADERQRIATDNEMKDGLEAMAKALSKANKNSKEEGA